MHKNQQIKVAKRLETNTEADTDNVADTSVKYSHQLVLWLVGLIFTAFIFTEQNAYIGTRMSIDIHRTWARCEWSSTQQIHTCSECSRNSPLHMTSTNARWILYMAASNKNSPHESMYTRLTSGKQTQNTGGQPNKSTPTEPSCGNDYEMWRNGTNDRWTMTHKSIHLHLSLSRATGIVRECPTSITYNVVLLQLSLTKIKAVFRNVNTLQKAVERPTEMTNTQAGGQRIT